jgi:hypothetical protein
VIFWVGTPIQTAARPSTRRRRAREAPDQRRRGATPGGSRRGAMVRASSWNRRDVLACSPCMASSLSRRRRTAATYSRAAEVLPLPWWPVVQAGIGIGLDAARRGCPARHSLCRHRAMTKAAQRRRPSARRLLPLRRHDGGPSGERSGAPRLAARGRREDQALKFGGRPAEDPG